jgi:hypothetical protein
MPQELVKYPPDVEQPGSDVAEHLETVDDLPVERFR